MQPYSINNFFDGDRTKVKEVSGLRVVGEVSIEHFPIFVQIGVLSFERLNLGGVISKQFF